MEHFETLDVITHIIENGIVPKPNQVTRKVGIYQGPKVTALDEETENFLIEVARGDAGRDDSRAYDEAIWRNLTSGISLC